MEIVELIHQLDIKCIKEIEEKLDEQFKALSYLHKNLPDKKSFPLLVILNSIVSYQLNTTGERYWWEFARFFSYREIKDEIVDMINFLKLSRGNRRFFEVKKNRIEKFKQYVHVIKQNYLYYYENMLELRDLLSKILNQSQNAKTIVFSVKMYGYASRIYFNKFIPFPMEINIPLDSRIQKISLKFGVKDPITFWNNLAIRSKIPPLHLDSILWVLYGIEDESKLENVCLEKKDILKKLWKIIK